MRILVDADSCSVRKQIEKVAMIYGIRVLFYSNTSSRICPKFGRVVKVDTYPDAVDEALLRRCSRDDIVITQDYGLAAECLAHEAYVIHPNGWLYTEDTLLRKHPENAKKRTNEDNKNFEWLFEGVIRMVRMKMIS